MVYKFIVMGYIVLLLAIMNYINTDGKRPDYIKMFQKETQDQLKSNVIIIGPSFFTDRDDFNSTKDDIKRYLDSLGPRSIALGLPKTIEMSIISGGGNVRYYEDFTEELGKRLRLAHVKCKIGLAGSMAFTFMLDYCDEREFFYDSLVMQHQVYINFFGFKIINDATIMMSRKYSDLEAERLGFDKDYWYGISREQGDKFFTAEDEYSFNLRTN